MNDFGMTPRDVQAVQLDKTPFYRRNRFPESYQYAYGPELLGSISNNAGSATARDLWQIDLPVPARQNLKDPFINTAQICYIGEGIWDAADTGNSNRQQGFPYLLRLYRRVNGSEFVDIFGSVNYDGRRDIIPIYTACEQFQIFCLAGRPNLYIAQVGWTAYGTLGVTFT